MNISAIIEARCGSSRLPGKVLLPVLGKPILYHLIQRLKQSRLLNDIIVATSLNKKDDRIESFCKKNKIKFFRGSESNVLNRVINAAIKFDVDTIVQITGDCPLIDKNILDKVIRTYLRNKVDFATNVIPRSYPDGMDVCVFSRKTLETIESIVKDKKFLEHTSLYFIKNQKKFKIKSIVAPKKLFLPDLGLTLDEIEDYYLIRNIINFFKKRKYFSCHEIIDLLKKKKDWLNINKNIKRNIV
jgi:spore coat polysaccharide biosynthesis protein SpsF